MPSEKSFRRHLCVMRTITLCLGKANRTYAGFVARRGHYPRARIGPRARLCAAPRRALAGRQAPAGEFIGQGR